MKGEGERANRGVLRSGPERGRGAGSPTDGRTRREETKKEQGCVRGTETSAHRSVAAFHAWNWKVGMSGDGEAVSVGGKAGMKRGRREDPRARVRLSNAPERMCRGRRTHLSRSSMSKQWATSLHAKTDWARHPRTTPSLCGRVCLP